MHPLDQLNFEIHSFLASLDADWRTRCGESSDPVTTADTFVADWRPHVSDRLDALFARMSADLEDADPELRKRITTAHRMLIQPYFMSSPFARRCVDKPLGYPGDYGTVEMIYKHDDGSRAPLGRLLGEYCLQSGPCDAHRGRMPWTHARLAELEGERPRLLSFACGPEFVLRRWVADGGVADIVLADHDPNALAYASRELRKVIRRTGNTSTVTTMVVNAKDVLTSDETVVSLGEYDCVMVLGLLDYLPDETVVRFLRRLSPTVRTGGAMLTSNLTGPNPWRSLMELTSEWTVAHRSVAGFEALISATGTLATVRTDVHRSGVNLYSASVKL